MADALARGAAADCERAAAAGDVCRTRSPGSSSPDRSGAAWRRAAANFYGRPAEALKLVGVTGTNGKTTTTLSGRFDPARRRIHDRAIGTTGYRTPRGSRTALNTTPESLDLQEMFAEVRDAGGTHAVLEASSHALAMDRLWGCHFAVGDFHESDARSSRLSQNVRGLFRGEAAPV